MYVFCRLRILPVSIIESFIPPKGLILDVGCGFGVTSIFFALSSPKRKVIGLDIRGSRIKTAKQASFGISNISFITSDLLNSYHHQVDSIVIVDLFHHLCPVQKNKLLQQCYRLLSPGGKLIIKEINTTPLLLFAWNYLHDLVINFHLGGCLNFLNHQQMLALLNRYNFNVSNYYPMTVGLYPHHFYVCEKK